MEERARSVRQDWRFTMALLSTAVFLDMAAWGQTTAFTPLYLKNELNVPLEEVPRWTGLLASASLLLAVPLSPFWGVLADRYSRKAVIARAELCSALVYALASQCTNVWQFLGARFLLGFAYGSIALAIATQTLVTPSRRVGTAVGVIQMAVIVAGSLGPLLGSFVINAFGMRAMFALNSALSLISAMLILTVLKEPDVHDRTTSISDKLKVVFGQVTTVPAIRWNFVAWFLIFGAVSAIDPYLPVQIDHLMGGEGSATTIGLLLAAYGVLTGLFTPVAGGLADRFGAARLFFLATLLLVFMSAGLGAAATLPVLALLVMVRAGPQSGTSVVLYSHLASHVPRLHRASVMSLTPMPRNAAALISPAIAAVISGFGTSWVFFYAAGIYGAATVVAGLLARATPSRGKPGETTGT